MIDIPPAPHGSKERYPLPFQRTDPTEVLEIQFQAEMALLTDAITKSTALAPWKMAPYLLLVAARRIPFFNASSASSRFSCAVQ